MLYHKVLTNVQSTQWVTFIHGAGGSSSIWYQQIRAFQKHFNILLLDLRGHGESFKNSNSNTSNYSFELVSNDIIEVLNFLKIEKSHFVGISLGTILIRQIAEKNSNRIDKIVMAGAIYKMNFRAQVLMKLGAILKFVLPYMYLYKLFAFIILPNKNHAHSRLLFVKEAKKMNQKEFIKWYQLTSIINPILSKFRKVEITIPTLFIMGNQDYMFLKSIQKYVFRFPTYNKLNIINNCGHIVNIQKSELFNSKSIAFLKS